LINWGEVLYELYSVYARTIVRNALSPKIVNTGGMDMSDIVKTTFGDGLRQYRRTLNITQQELALRCDISTRFYQYLEKGTRTPSLITLFRLADALETTPHKIIDSSWGKWQKENKD